MSDAPPPNGTGQRPALAALPHPGESLIGLVHSQACRNVLGSTRLITAEAGRRGRASAGIALDGGCDPEQLAWVLKLDVREVEDRLIPDWLGGKGLTVDFGGARVARSDLALASRRVAPASLRISPHHRQAWLLRLVPMCVETGGLIISTCTNPTCPPLGWTAVTESSSCGECGADLRDVAADVLDRDAHDGAFLMAALVHPDPTRNATALSRLAAGLEGVNRGDAFTFGWELGRLSQGHATTARPPCDAGHGRELIAALEHGWGILAGWPGSIRSIIANGNTSAGHTAATAVICHVRRTVNSVACDTRLRDAILAGLPEARNGARSAIRQVAGGLGSGEEARRALGIAQKPFDRLRGSGVVNAVFERGTVNKHGVFALSDLEPIAEALADRASAAGVARRWGISFHGVEQLTCLGNLTRPTGPNGPLPFHALHVSASSASHLATAIRSAAASFVHVDRVALRPLRDLLRAVGGREKPWGPILARIADGVIPFALDEGIEPMSRRIVIDPADLPLLSSLTFDRADHADFPFSSTMTGVDAGELLNLHPVALDDLLKREFPRHRGTSGRYRIEPLLAFARGWIGGPEVKTRWSGGSRKYPRMLSAEGRLRRQGPNGWPRAEVEELMAGLSPQRLQSLRRASRPRSTGTQFELSLGDASW